MATGGFYVGKWKGLAEWSSGAACDLLTSAVWVLAMLIPIAFDASWAAFRSIFGEGDASLRRYLVAFEDPGKAYGLIIALFLTFLVKTGLRSLTLWAMKIPRDESMGSDFRRWGLLTSPAVLLAMVSIAMMTDKNKSEDTRGWFLVITLMLITFAWSTVERCHLPRHGRCHFWGNPACCSKPLEAWSIERYRNAR